MNRNYFWLIVVVLLAGSVLTTMLARAQETRPNIQWEYNIVVMPWSISPTSYERVEAKLNELGEAGWELIASERMVYVLKRPSGNQP